MTDSTHPLPSSHEHPTSNGDAPSSKPNTPQSVKNGWDGKLRVNRQATLANPEALEDPDYSDEDAPPVDQIEADEGWWATYFQGQAEMKRWLMLRFL